MYHSPFQSILRSAHKVYLSASYDSQNKRRLFPLNSINQLIFVMVKCGVLFEVRTEFLNII
jgi:hypothetical protein